MKQSASQTVGPFFRIGLIYDEEQSDLVKEKTVGAPIIITGLVSDGQGEPMLDAMIEIWQPDANGIFNHPNDPRQAEADPNFRGYGRSETRNDGNYQFKTIKPGSRDGQAPYINVHVFARGMLVHAITRIYFPEESTNSTDPTLLSIPEDRRHTLIAQKEEKNGMTTYRFNINIQGENETVFFNP